MESPTKNARDGVNNDHTNSTASPQNRRPPKLRTSKPEKRPTPDSDRDKASGYSRDTASQRSGSSSVAGIPNGAVQESSQDIPSREETPAEARRSYDRPSRRHRRRQRSESIQPVESNQVQVYENQQKDLKNPETKTQDSRVRQMLRPEAGNQELAALAKNSSTIQQGQNPSDGTGANAVQTEENVEEVKKKGKNDQLRLRLDLNLDIEIELKAKIRGDLTLALL